MQDFHKSNAIKQQSNAIEQQLKGNQALIKSITKNFDLFDDRSIDLINRKPIKRLYSIKFD